MMNRTQKQFSRIRAASRKHFPVSNGREWRGHESGVFGSVGPDNPDDAGFDVGLGGSSCAPTRRKRPQATTTE